jgi:hypothetical protein
MTEDDVVAITRAYIEGLFPKRCATCGRQFTSLKDYLQNTTHLETPVLYDSLEKGVPADPLGPMSMANCRCGNTITVSSFDMPADQLTMLLNWVRRETVRRKISARDLLQHIRDRIDEQVLAD